MSCLLTKNIQTCFMKMWNLTCTVVHVTRGRVMSSNQPQLITASLYLPIEARSKVEAGPHYSESVTPGQPPRPNLIFIKKLIEKNITFDNDWKYSFV